MKKTMIGWAALTVGLLAAMIEDGPTEPIRARPPPGEPSVSSRERFCENR